MDLGTRTSTPSERSMSHAAQRRSLYEQLEDLPEGLTGEIIDGQLHTEPRPAPRHALAATNLAAELIGPYSRGRNGPGGWWILVEPALHFRRDAEVLVPDLAGWRRARMADLPLDQRLEIPPDWICEVLSPSTRSKDREIKMPLYASYGVAYAWLIDGSTQTLEAYELRGSAWAQLGVYSVDSAPGVAPFETASFRIADLWT